MQSHEIWFVVGSQHLYGPEALRQVASNAEQVARALDASPALPIKIVGKGIATTPDEVKRLTSQADSDPACAGLILWMHTFSPAKMWVASLARLRKPVCHLHTQFSRDLPWETLDMDYMNLHQSAHGDREAGHGHVRAGLRRKVVVGHWADPDTLSELGAWARAASAWAALQTAKIARFGDNMREVAVTEGDKVEAEKVFGFSVNGYGIGDLVAVLSQISDADIDRLCQEYDDLYGVSPDLQLNAPRRNDLREAARIELALRTFLTDGGFQGFTTTFEDLHGLRQLPGLAVQRLMNDGYGFGAEGDWKTSALLYAMKQMGAGLPGGTSFMEDYTYHLDPSRPLVLGAHMLEVCPSIASAKPSLEIHPLGIGGKDDPVRLVFDAAPGEALNASLVDLGHRFRLVVNRVRTVPPPHPLPKLPVARAVWECQPDFKTAAACWILAGGAHHTGYSTQVTAEMLQDFAEIAGIEIAEIDDGTTKQRFREALRWNDAAYRTR